jgi:hypothetical protein
MPTSSPWIRLAMALILACQWSPLLGQWIIKAEVGADRFSGGSRSAQERSFLPYRPTTFGLGLERQGGRLGIGFQLQYASAALGLEGPEGVVAVNGVFTRYSVSPELLYRITSVESANQLLLHLGPLFEVWSVPDEESQPRVGAQGAVSFRVALRGRFGGSVTAGAALIPSPFGEDQLTSEFERRPLWRRRVAAGLTFRL